MKKEKKVYPERYHRLFKAISAIGGIVFRSEMDEIIKIVREDFPQEPEFQHGWWNDLSQPFPTYLKVKPGGGTRYRVYKHQIDFTYEKNGHIIWNDGGGLLPHYAKPATEKEYLKYRKTVTE